MLRRSARTNSFMALSNLVVFLRALPVLQGLLQIRVQSFFEPHQVFPLSLTLPQTPLSGLQLQAEREQGALDPHQLTLQLGEG